MYCAGIYVLFMGPATTLFRKKYILKMDFTVLFIYLKIILLQCFSVFSCIQTDPKSTNRICNVKVCWCKSRYEEQRVFIIFLFLFELGFIYSSTLNYNPFPSWIGILIVFLFLVKLFFLSLVEIGLLFLFLKGVGEILFL